jgi:LacI family transcriptional regulator
LYTISERIKGYEETIKAAGLECLLDTSITDYKSTETAIRKVLDGPNPPDAIFALKNSTTIYAFEVLQKLNVSVPESVALLGFDDFELASTVRPSISVIQQPVDDIGRIAAELLFEQLFDGGKAASHARARNAQQVKLETHLIRRSSCGCHGESV